MDGFTNGHRAIIEQVDLHGGRHLLFKLRNHALDAVDHEVVKAGAGIIGLIGALDDDLQRRVVLQIAPPALDARFGQALGHLHAFGDDPEACGQ